MKKAVIFLLLAIVIVAAIWMMSMDEADSLEDKAKGTIAYLTDEMQFDVADKVVKLKKDFFDDNELIDDTIEELEYFKKYSMEKIRNIDEQWMPNIDANPSGVNTDQYKMFMKKYREFMDKNSDRLDDMITMLAEFKARNLPDEQQVRDVLSEYMAYTKELKAMEAMFGQTLVKTDDMINQNSPEVRQGMEEVMKLDEIQYRIVEVKDKLPA